MQGITGVITLVASAAFYKYIVDFIQPWEEGIRTRNNTPDMRHLPMTWARKLSLWAMLAAIVALLGYALFADDMSGWLFLALLVAFVGVLTAVLTTWPRSDEWAHRGPGIVWRVPGWFSWTHIPLKREIRTPVMDNTSDARGEPVHIQLAYQWSRTGGNPPQQWKSWNNIENLELSMDAHLMGVVQLELKCIDSAVMMTPGQLRTFAERVFSVCKDEFYAEYGTTLYYVAVASIGPPPQVAGSRIIAAALSRQPQDETVEQARVAEAAAASLESSLSG